MRVRFAPSPTGALHIGGARTALYNWLLARGTGGTFVLRIEDTDRERSTPENVEQILDALRWLELDWDEGPFSQAERGDRHKRGDRAAAATTGTPTRTTARCACACPTRARPWSTDVIRGEVAFPHAAIEDFVIRRSDGSPLYNLAVAVDDRDMGITHVVRGEDHISNTPRQVMILEALGAEPPGLRPPAAAARPRRQEALEAPRRGVGAGAARRGLPARGGAQLHRAARLGLRRRRPRSSPPTSWSSASTARARLEEPGRVRRAEAALDERPLPARAAGRRTCAARLEELTGPRAAARGRGDQPGEDADAGRLLAAGRLPGRARSEIDEKAWAKVMRTAPRERLRAAREALEQASSRSTREQSSSALRGVVERARRQAQGRLPAGARGDQPAPPSRRASSSRSRRWAATRRWPASIRALEQAAGALTAPALNLRAEPADSGRDERTMPVELPHTHQLRPAAEPSDAGGRRAHGRTRATAVA